MTGEAFKEYLRSQLGPTLKPGDIVICDNLLAHKVAERTYDKLWRLIGKLLDEFHADECLNLFRHSGYVST
jgi:transposase